MNLILTHYKALGIESSSTVPCLYIFWIQNILITVARFTLPSPVPGSESSKNQGIGNPDPILKESGNWQSRSNSLGFGELC